MDLQVKNVGSRLILISCFVFNTENQILSYILKLCREKKLKFCMAHITLL